MGMNKFGLNCTKGGVRSISKKIGIHLKSVNPPFQDKRGETGSLLLFEILHF